MEPKTLDTVFQAKAIFFVAFIHKVLFLKKQSKRKIQSFLTANSIEM